MARIVLLGSNGMVGQSLKKHFLNENNHEIISPIRDELNLEIYQDTYDFFEKTKPDLIINCAGKVGGILDNKNNQIEYLDKNLLISRNAIMASYNAKIKKFFNIASTCVYPENSICPISEDMINMGPPEKTNEGYALAKIIGVKLCEYINNLDLGYKYITLLPCNLYGPGDKFDKMQSHLIPAAIMKVYEAKTNNAEKLIIWGDGKSRREFMYVDDLADFIILLIKKFEFVPTKINVGNGWDLSVNEYYQAVSEALEYDFKIFNDLSKPSGVFQKLCDVSIQSSLGWKPKTQLNFGIKKTFEYYKGIINE